jgi:hypothetical protein
MATAPNSVTNGIVSAISGSSNRRSITAATSAANEIA